MKELWTEKYRPKTIKEYVFVDDTHKNQVMGWINQQAIPHLLFSGEPGVGKTTLARVLFNELNVESGDILEINASNENGVDVIREKINRFASTMPIGNFKYILLDEADFITKNGQMALRGIMERYHVFTRFILTCNYPDRIDDALHSRCETFHITKINEDEFIKRIATILITENVEFDPNILNDYISATYPDLRSCIKLCQSNSLSGQLSAPSEASHSEKDYIIMAVALFKEKRYQEARKLICEKARRNDYTQIYKMMYNNLDWWTDDPNLEKLVLIKIANGLKWHDQVADPEILLSATLCELEIIIENE